MGIPSNFMVLPMLSLDSGVSAARAEIGEKATSLLMGEAGVDQADYVRFRDTVAMESCERRELTQMFQAGIGERA